MVNANRVTAVVVAGMFCALLSIMALTADAGEQGYYDQNLDVYVLAGECQQNLCATTLTTETKAKKLGIFKRIKLRRAGARAAGEQARNTFELKTKVIAKPSATQTFYLHKAPAEPYYAPPVPQDCVGMDDSD